MRADLETRGLWAADREQRLLAEVRVDVDRALAEARVAEPPPPNSLFDDVYAQPTWNLREQRETKPR
jgi:TPP-dependent pyruvate/acetoin dehydrogenase alpha subunit